MQQQSELPVNAIFQYLSLYFFNVLFLSLHHLYVYKGNYLSYQEKLRKVNVVMETIGITHDGAAATKLLMIHDKPSCDFDGYDADILMKETAKLRKLITKKGTLEILIPLCCTTSPVRYIKFRHTLS